MRIVIVGNGPAALAAVEAIRERDQASGITILSGDSGAGYTPCFLAKYVAGSVDIGGLALRPEDFYERHHVELVTGHEVTAVRPEDNVVVLDDGSRIGYDRLLIASGAEPLMPEGPDLSGQGVFAFRTLTDAAAIRAAAEHVRDAGVLGSGFVAMEIAEALAETGAAVTVIARRERILRRIFDAEVAGMVEAHMSGNGVRFLKGRDLAGVERGPGSTELSAVVLSDGERLACDMLVVGVGMRPNIALVAGTSIATGRGILTDAAMRTSVRNVYAAGDVAEAEIEGIRKANLIHPNAVATGHVAGYNIAGGDQRMSAHLADMNVLTVFGRSFLAVGALEGEKILRRSAGPDGLVKVFADEAGFIKGVELVGDVTRGGLYASLIARNVNVSATPDLLAPTFNYGETSGQAAWAS
ncbi:MAG TPA: FAD-dependent oxidoreductase [Coriobacteriia bacterium]